MLALCNGCLSFPDQVQDEYASRIGEGYILGMENALAVVQDYQALRKKLDSRRYVLPEPVCGNANSIDSPPRLALDAATRKLNSSKKDSRALEDEVESAQARLWVESKYPKAELTRLHLTQ